MPITFLILWSLMMDAVLPPAILELGFDISFDDLYDRDGLTKLDAAFFDFLTQRAPDTALALQEARHAPDTLDAKSQSALLLDIAEHFDVFIGELFGIQDAMVKLRAQHDALAPLFSCKRLFVQRKAQKAYKPDAAAELDGEALLKTIEGLTGSPFDELAFANAVMQWLDAPEDHAENIDIATKFAAWASHTPEGQALFHMGVLFQQPQKRDPMELVHMSAEQNGPIAVKASPPGHLRRREGFSLTDNGADLAHALDQGNYCITCHNQGKDSCNHGLRDRKTDELLITPLGRTMAGCPLEEHISEMIAAKRDGHTAAALGMITINNPLCAGTGHRICNDCMVACVYQNQMRDPVNIPEIETRILKDILALPWGFEIYALMTRWNPFNLKTPLPAAATGYNVLVAGLGPAGYSLAQRLLQDGHTVVAVDGLKIEPLPSILSGMNAVGNPVPFQPIRDIATLWEDLNERITAGFGGVAEYGITVRWDKNFLTVIRLILERNRNFRMFGGIRFGSNLDFKDAKAYGFDHVALCLGAGKPTIVPMGGKLSPGVRQASDFLMALQLTGAAHEKSVANLQLRLPVAVIGGGLTAIDACTESLAYYPLQVEKFLSRYETLVEEQGEEAVRASWTEAEAEIANEYIDHARQIRAERDQAVLEDRHPRILEMLRAWGGVTLVYRRKLTASPAYKNNHEEIIKALEEGIFVAEEWSPMAVHQDKHGWAETLQIQNSATKEEQIFPAKTVIVAAGTVPNITLSREGIADFKLDGKYFQALDEDMAPVSPELTSKPEQAHVLIDAKDAGMPVSFFGDLHPGFAGNVVAAMASARAGAPIIGRTLAKASPFGRSAQDIFAEMNTDLRATLLRVDRLTPNIVEVVVHAPQAAKRFQPGQFFRLQNYAANALETEDTILAMEGIALTGAWVDAEKGELAMIVLEMGGSSDLCKYLQPGEPVVIMGPSGAPTDIPENSTVALVGGGLGNAVLFSIGKALKDKGNRVLYFAGYKFGKDRFKVEDILAASDVVIWCCDEPADFEPERPDDKTFTGNIVQAMVAYAEGRLGEQPIPMLDVERIIAIGSDRMMGAVKAARHGVLKNHLKPCHSAIASVNSPMQCMMKEICGQCLQRHEDPKTGEETIVFTCAGQDQDMERVDFTSLHERLSQNTVQEKLTRQWVARELKNL